MNRNRAIQRIAVGLRKRGWPRLTVSIAFLFAALVAFGSSYLMLRLGLADMGTRYAIATCIAYGAFLLFLRVWVGAIRRLEADVNPLDAVDAATSPRSQGGPRSTSDTGSTDPTDYDPSLSDLPIPDLDEGVLLLIPLLVLGAGVIASLYVIYAAPILLAELLLDVVIASSLARRFERVQPERWYYGAFGHTYKAFLGLVVTVSLLGFLAQFLAPGADSIGDLLPGSRPNSHP